MNLAMSQNFLVAINQRNSQCFMTAVRWESLAVMVLTVTPSKCTSKRCKGFSPRRFGNC
jgi:hypothetical protein